MIKANRLNILMETDHSPNKGIIIKAPRKQTGIPRATQNARRSLRKRARDRKKDRLEDNNPINKQRDSSQTFGILKNSRDTRRERERRDSKTETGIDWDEEFYA